MRRNNPIPLPLDRDSYALLYGYLCPIRYPSCLRNQSPINAKQSGRLDLITRYGRTHAMLLPKINI